MNRKFANILETVGNTPVVKIEKLAPDGIDLYAKLEAFNPMGSVKDRLALGVIEDAERRGLLAPGQTVIEATSGNTGIGLAMVCARKGYPLVVTMAENFSLERRKLLRFFGAKVVLTPAADKGSGMLAKAIELAERHGWFLCRQFDNEANAEMHSRTTAQEILKDFSAARLDYWVTGFGTGGTLKGVARVLASERPETQIVVCEPDNVPILGSGIAQERHPDGTPRASHPRFRPHLMQGWSPDFISSLTEQAVATKLIDRVIPVNGNEALRQSRALAREEGILTGISGGATFAGALELSRTAPSGSTILCMLPDTGERYLSTALFEDINVDMNEEEMAISTSTPSARFDTTPTKPASSTTTASIAKESPKIDAEAATYLARAIGDPTNPVVMFALEWCEFCWSVRRFFAQLRVPCRSVDLDSVDLQPGDLGGRIRTGLTARTGCRTIPQIFVGETFVGGCSELFEAHKNGSLHSLLTANGVSFDDRPGIDPDTFVPTWVQSRKSVERT
ncbi:pyridoxal-phosphate dependent enzyme [Pelagibius litoralis]|uniref:Cysteine synthase B n=1 Tax=Pelagibius litoralis TaxID=374515 RepID=A0A967EXE5_9PROT|nr:pyridoxal-phosphate dependent enzyme [Pelagibius litoralis]NIA69140.1 pyridoxal-phosphate dependent enzyme [Pelagibius litoralis]